MDKVTTAVKTCPHLILDTAQGSDHVIMSLRTWLDVANAGVAPLAFTAFLPEPIHLLPGMAGPLRTTRSVCPPAQELHPSVFPSYSPIGHDAYA